MDQLERPIALTCPECGGALRETGGAAVKEYRCHTGHRFGPKEVLDGQIEEVEHAFGVAERVPELVRQFEEHGVEHWARQNMGNRLGSAFPPEGFEWWCKFMGRTALSTQLGFMGTIACADIRADVPKIACPTLVITTEESGLATVDETRAWQQQIRESEVIVLPGNSYHVAATHAAESARATLNFLQRRGN